MEACLQSTLPPTEELDESLRNGIALAFLAKHFQPSAVKKIYEVRAISPLIHQDKSKLVFRHSDNINFFFKACKIEGLPEVLFSLMCRFLCLN
jgi:hypothetical protein